MPVRINIGGILRDLLEEHRTAKRKRSEILRQYVNNRQNLDSGEIELIPQQDARVNYLHELTQFSLIRTNNEIRSIGRQHPEKESVYIIPEHADTDGVEKRLNQLIERIGTVYKILIVFIMAIGSLLPLPFFLELTALELPLWL